MAFPAAAVAEILRRGLLTDWYCFVEEWFVDSLKAASGDACQQEPHEDTLEPSLGVLDQ